MTRALHQLVKWFYLLSAILLIILAVVVQSGRSFSHLLGDYTQNIASYLSETLNAQVAIGQIEASWDGLKPSLDLQQLSVHSQAGQPILAFERARIRLDILGSLAHQRWVWSNVILSDVQVDFAQQPSGKWLISGLPANTNAADDPKAAGIRLKSLVDMLLLSNRIEFQGSRLGFNFVDGREVELKTPLLLLENADDFHRLSLQVDVDGEARRVYLMLEGQGDPRDSKHFRSRGYLQLNQFPTSEPVAALNAFLLHGIDHSQLKTEGKISANIWFESRPDADGFDVFGNIELQRLLLPFAGRQLQLDEFKSELAGYWLHTGQWQLGLQDISAQYQAHAISDLNLALSYTAGDQPLQMRMNRLDIPEFTGLLQDAGVLGTGRMQEVLQSLAPQGQLSNLHLDLPLHNPSDWQLRANVQSVAVNAWQGVPALTGVDGYLQLGRRHGFINLDSRAGFSMHYIPSYQQPMVYDRVRGQVAWHLDPDNNQVYVNSGPLKFYQGEESVTGYMWLSIPWRRNTGDIDLYLHIGGQELSAGLYQKYLPALVPASLSTWLDQSVGEQNPGIAHTAGFIYRATLNSKDPRDRSFDLYLDLARSRLDYNPGWPALDNLHGRLLVSNADIRASVLRAQVYDSQVETAEIRMRPRQQGKGSLLRVKGKIQGNTTDGMRVLREGILRRHIGSNMDSWFLSGDMRTTLDLAIPVGTDQAKPADAFQQVDVDLQAPAFELQNLNLTLSDLRGRITYNSAQGLSSQGLQAYLFSEPVTAELSTRQLKTHSQTRIQIGGAVESQTLARWSKRPEILFLDGKLPYTTVVELNHRAHPGAHVDNSPTSDLLNPDNFARQAFAKVTFTSNLQGVKVNLPGVYRKSTGTKRPLKFTWWLQEAQSQAQLKYAGKLQALFRLDRRDNNRLLNASIALDKTAEFNAAPEFLVRGYLPDFDLEAWKKVLSRYQTYREQLGISPELEQAGADPSRIAGLVFRADLTLGQYTIGNLRLENLAVTARREYSGWHLGVKNPVIEGALFVPESADFPLQVNLKYLRLTPADIGEKEFVAGADSLTAPEKVQGKSTIDPRKLPLANIAIDELYLDNDSFGSWSLQLRPNSRGVVIDNIHGSIRGMTINGAKESLDGAKLIWQEDDQGVKTRFIGGISAGDIAEVMRQWNKPDTLESQAARFVLDIYWKGTPQDFKLVDINGDMTLWFEKGRFKRNASAEDGLLRLLSVLNFDSLARRMRMDFSDLYQSGLAYDQINGKVHFNQGIMEFIEPLEVRGPSSRLQMAGSIDLRRERINTRLVATLPVAGNLTFFTALVTGLPAAAGIYVVSKLFKKQMDQVTSISYSITGSWDKPKMRFDRLFESENSLRDSVKSKAPNTKLLRPEEYEDEAASG